MNRILLLVVAGLVCSPGAAAEPTADDYLNFLRPVIGHWTVKASIGDKTAEGTFSAQLSPTKRSIVSSASATLQYPALDALEGYDPEAKKWKWSAFSSTGEHWVAYLSAGDQSLKGKKQATFKFETSVAKPDGSKDTWRGDYTVTIGKDQWKGVFTNQALNGQKQPDEEYTYERRKKQLSSQPAGARQSKKSGPPRVTPAALPAGFVKDCHYYLGDWATEVEIGGTLYRGTWTVKWSPDKTCLVTHWAADTPDGPAKGTRIHGWDALTKKMLVVDFARDGSSSIERYTITSNQVSDGEISGVEADGKPFQATARAEHKTPDFFTWTVTRDAQVMEYRFHRVKK